MTLHDIDLSRFMKIKALAEDPAAVPGERENAKAMLSSMAQKAGVGLEEAMSHAAPQQQQKRNIFDGFDDWMENREPGWKAKQAVERAEKERQRALDRADALSRYGSEQALFEETVREKLLVDAVEHLAEFSTYVDHLGVTRRYASKLDGEEGEVYWLSDITDRVRCVISEAYPIPTSLRGVLDEISEWERLRLDRQLFLEWGEYIEGREVRARIVVLENEMNTRPVRDWDDMGARLDWRQLVIDQEIVPLHGEEQQFLDRLRGDAEILSKSEAADPVQNGRSAQFEQRRSNAQKRASVLSILDAYPELSDREIARQAGVSPQTVNNWRRKRPARI